MSKHLSREEYNAYMREYMLRRYHKRMNLAREILGGKCVICGHTEDLHLDHIDYHNKSFTIGKLWCVNSEKFLAEVAKCQLLCRQHHEEKSVVEIQEMALRREAKKREDLGGFKHGTIHSYNKYKCRCSACVAAKKPAGRKISPPGSPIQHGTRGGYLLEVRRKLPTCEACRKANADYTRSLATRKNM